MRLHLLTLGSAVVLACSSAGGETGETDSGGTDTDSTAGTGTESGTGTTGATDSGTGGELLPTDPVITRYERQPMVVDIELDAAEGATVELVHTTDPGVVIAERPGMPGVYRVRGLAPDTSHDVDLTVSLDGAQDQRTLTFDTHPALPGFIPVFAVSSPPDRDPESVYRLVDLSVIFGSPAIQGAAVVDPEGTTRWYLGVEVPMAEPLGLWAGITLLDDGTVHFTQSSAFRVVDELGDDLVTVTKEQLGVPLLHHDGIKLPNGNYMAMSVVFQDVDYGGMEGVLHVYGDLLVEFDPAGNVEWTWDAFDHLDPQRRRDGFHTGLPLEDPETGETAKDWTHGNGIVHLPEDDTILVSLRHQDWVLKIDHATGDIIWRLGDEGDFQLTAGTWFFHQHSPQPQPDGSLLLYDNAVGNPNQPDEQAHARAVRYQLDEVAMTAEQVWEDDHEPFRSDIMGDADVMPGGNVLILDSSLDFEVDPVTMHSRLREVDPKASPMAVWSIETPPGRVMYRARPETRLVGQAAP